MKSENRPCGSILQGVSCKRTKITRAPCSRRTGTAVPRAENFGDLITADHKVLDEESESRNNHRYSVVVQDFGHPMDSIFSVKTKTSQEDGKEFTEVSRAVGKDESHLYRQSLEFGKSCEDSSRNHCTSTLHRSETNGIAERAVRRVKEGTSAALLQSGLDERWWSDSMEFLLLSCEMSKPSWQMGMFFMKNDSENHSKDP